MTESEQEQFKEDLYALLDKHGIDGLSGVLQHKKGVFALHCDIARTELSGTIMRVLAPIIDESQKMLIETINEACMESTKGETFH